MVTINGREVVDIEITDVDPCDYPDFCDAYFCHARFADTGEALSDDEIEELNDLYPDVVNEMAYEYFL